MFSATEHFLWEQEHGVTVETRSISEVLDEVIANDDRSPSLWLIEDYLTEDRLKDKRVLDVVSSGSNHYGISTIITAQTIFSSRPELRVISLQATLYLLWPSVRDPSQFNRLSKQLFPSAPSDFLLSASRSANKDSRSHKTPILVQTSNSFEYDEYRVCSGALPNESLVLYLPKQ